MIERGYVAFKPTVPPVASFELTFMPDTMRERVKGKITPEGGYPLARIGRGTIDFDLLA